MSCKDEIAPVQLVILSSIFSFILADDRSADELNVLGQFVATVGDMISLMAAQKENNEKQKEKEPTKQDILKQIKELQVKCEKLK